MNLRPLWIAGRFLTRLPFPDPGAAEPAETGRSVPWYPLVGGLMGSLIALAALALRDADAGIAAALVLALWAWSSGGLHLDGLGDAADGWVGGLGSRERTLEIMKDPRCGPAAVSTITLVLISKWAGLQALLATDQLWPLILLPMLGRTQLPLLLLTTPYARKQGMAADQFNQLPRRAAWGAAFAATAVSLLVGGWLGALLVATGIAVLFLARRGMLARIGGFTGDTAGAVVELTETALLLVSSLALGGAGAA